MCGIAGFFDLRHRRSSEENDNLATAMGNLIRHRGPDACAIWTDRASAIWLIHRRLAIIDLSEAGAQPMATSDGTARIIYNGEIYNAAELRELLAREGYSFRGHSDTEVVLNACHRWGIEGAVKRLNGFFAFAYWDRAKNRLFLARDRMGKKPLYWTQSNGGFAFASELSPIMLLPELSCEVDRSSVLDLLRYAYIPAPNSIFSDVKKLTPGSILEYDPERGSVEIRPYWSLFEAVQRTRREGYLTEPHRVLEETSRLLEDAVRVRMISDVPLGAFLSGGIDSSAVVAVMQSLAGAPIKTFSIGYADAEYDESRDAQKVAAHLGTDHTSLVLEPEAALSVIPSLSDIFDEPFADASQVPTYLVSKLARQDVTVALSGDGGDEVFAGYNRHVAAAGLLPRLGRIPAGVRGALAKAIEAFPPGGWQRLFDLLPAHRRPRSAGEKMHKIAKLLAADPSTMYRTLVSQAEDPVGLALQGQERADFASDPAIQGAFADPVEHMRFLDLLSYLPNDILTKVDRASMATSLEVRAPLLDYRLVEHSFRIPSHVHLRDGQNKWVLRKILERHVPPHLFDRPKMGFGIPIGDWLRGPLRVWAEDLLSSDSVRSSGLLRHDRVQATWQRHLSGKQNLQYEIWPALMLQSWHSSYVGARGVKAEALYRRAATGGDCLCRLEVEDSSQVSAPA